MSNPIFTAAQFAAINYRRPFIGYPGNLTNVVPNPNNPVTLALSDNQVITVFDTKVTALKCIESMRLNNQWLLTPTDDIMIIAVSFTKLLLAESSLINQKLFASFLPIYFGGNLRLVHRSMSLVMSLADALSDVGFYVQDPLTNNYELANATRKPYIQVVDFNYRGSPTQAQPGSLLDDGPAAIQYNLVGPAPPPPVEEDPAPEPAPAP